MPLPDAIIIDTDILIDTGRCIEEALACLTHYKHLSDLRVPEAVWDEVINGTHDDPVTQGLPSADWAQQTKVEANMKVISWNLGAGETAVLSFALHNPQYSAIIDDRAARRCAHVLNISLCPFTQKTL